MKAILVPTYGDAEVLKYQEIPIPVIKPNEVLVQVCHAGVSPFDVHVRDGWYKESSHYSLPIVLGWELSGVVFAIGEKVTRFKPGDMVFAHPNVYRQGGAYAEYAAVQENEAAHKPANVTHAKRLRCL